MIRSASILWQLIAAGVVITSLAITFFTVYLIDNERDLVLEQAELRAKTVSSFVSLMLNQASRVEESFTAGRGSGSTDKPLELQFLSKDVLQNVIELAQFHGDIKLVRVIDHNFNVLASYPYGHAGEVEQTGFFEDSLAGRQRPRIVYSEIEKEKVIEITVPLVVYGSIAGIMDMGFSMEHLNAEIESIIRNAILLAVVFIVAQSLVISLFAKIFTGPILELAGAAKRISEGDNRVSIPVTRSNEIGYLQLSFRDAIDRQNTAIQTLNRTNTAYRRFVPREFLQFLHRDSIIDVRLGDQVKRDMAVLFSDIRSFTTLSESMTPVENFNFLNDYLSRMGPIIRDSNGFIDKYIGDAIMALFAGRSEDAVDAAVRMIETLNDADNWKRDNPLRIGIGIHTGAVMLGTIGETERMETTVISDAVNLSSRLEGLTKNYGIGIAVSKDTIDSIGDKERYHYRFIDRVQVKGKEKSIDVYEIYDGDRAEIVRAKDASRPVYQEGIQFYFERRFEMALRCFEETSEIVADDKVSWIYRERAMEYAKTPPGDDWTGIVVMDTK